MVIFVKMVNAHIKRVMIDTCSFTNIFNFDAFQKLGFTINDLTPMASSLTRFTNDSICPLGIVSLHVIFGDEPYSKTVMIKFTVVNILLAYNVIICRPILNILHAVNIDLSYDDEVTN